MIYYPVAGQSIAIPTTYAGSEGTGVDYRRCMTPDSPAAGRLLEQIAVVGAGAMGAMYAAHFVAAGFGVRLVARGIRAARLRTPGLLVNGEPLAAEVVDADAAIELEPADLIVFAVKDAHLADAIAEAAPLVNEHTTFLSVLNGLDSEHAIAAAYGEPGVLPCIALAMDAMREHNRVRFTQTGRLVFGPAHPAQDARVRAVQHALDRAGLAWETPDDMRHRMWWKFMVNVGINQASAVLRAPYGAFTHDGPARSLMLALINEVIAVSHHEGVDLNEADLASWDAVLSRQPVDGWTSMLQDVSAGRPTEVEIFAGKVVDLGVRHGVATPYNQAMLWILRGLSAPGS